MTNFFFSAPQLKRAPLGGTPMMRTILVLLSLLSRAASAAAQSPVRDTEASDARIDTAFVTSKDISPPVLIDCPSLPHTQRHGTVRVEMIVDTLGRPEPNSIKITATPDDSLSAIVLRTAPACHFKPGRYHRLTIRVPVQMPFTF